MNHTIRTADLKRMLIGKRREVRGETRSARIDDALMRLDEGKYGSCLECARQISESRLRALPFALRCQPCEERREQDGSGKHASDPKGRNIPHALDVLSR